MSAERGGSVLRCLVILQLGLDDSYCFSEVLANFYVTSLFTNVPVDEAVRVIKTKLQEDETLEDRTPLSAGTVAELVELCLRSTYFSYDGEFYEQREGAAMGSPVSAIVADLYMEFFEDLALETTLVKPRLWK